ncbi:MAG: DnaA N-terminal domain-containing protein [Halanaerobiales bacterium]
MSDKFEGFRSRNKLEKYTGIPNEFFDIIMKDLDKAEILIMLAIFRKTYGWVDYVDEETGQAYYKIKDNISQSQFMEMTGLVRNTVRDTLIKLENKGLIIKVSDYDSKTSTPACYAIKQVNVNTPSINDCQRVPPINDNEEDIDDRGGDYQSTKGGLSQSKEEPPYQSEEVQKKDLKKDLNTYNNINKDCENENLSTNFDPKIIEVFTASFERFPNQIQIKQLQSYNMEDKLLYNIIKKMGLGGHNPTYMFNKLDSFKHEGILTVKDLELSKAYPDKWQKFKEWDNVSFNWDETNDNISSVDVEFKKLDFVPSILKEDYDNFAVDDLILWNHTKCFLKEKLPLVSYNTWIKTIVPLDLNFNTLTLTVPNDMVQEWVEKRYKNFICNVMYSLTEVEIDLQIINRSDPI